MVYAFLIISLNTKHGPEVMFSQRFHNQTFNSQLSDVVKTRNDMSADHMTIKDALRTVSDRISVEYSFASTISKPTMDHKDARQSAIPELTTGVFFLSREKSPRYATDKHVIWCGALGLLFAFIIEPNENRGLASIILKYITKYVHDYIQPFKNHKSVILKPHIISLIVNKLLQCGQLQFINHKCTQQLEKELEQAISALNIAK